MKCEAHVVMRALAGNAVVGDIGAIKWWYIVAAALSLLWGLLTFSFVFSAMSLDVPPSVTVHIAQMMVSRLLPPLHLAD